MLHLHNKIFINPNEGFNKKRQYTFSLLSF